MCLFRRRKKDSVKAVEDRELIEQNSKSISSLIVLSESNGELVDKLKKLQEQLKYLKPSVNGKVFDYDKTIKNKIGDLKIALVKADGESSKQIDVLLRDIKVAIEDRNTIA